jgi:hypothetical protein
MVLGHLYGLGLGAKLDAMGNRASKTASQLETLIIEQLRLAHPDCDTQFRIMVKPIDGRERGWPKRFHMKAHR